jgi:hypothetical protein
MFCDRPGGRRSSAPPGCGIDSVDLQLTILVQRRQVSGAERVTSNAKYVEIAKMLTGLIAHLEAETENIVDDAPGG